MVRSTDRLLWFNSLDLADIYFEYYVAGVVIMMLYSASVFIGYDIFEEAEHGVFEYLLSLPVSRRELVFGRSIGGGIRSFVFVGLRNWSDKPS